MRMDIKKLIGKTKFGKVAAKVAIAGSLLFSGAAINQAFNQDDVSALDAPTPIVETVEEVTPIVETTEEVVVNTSEATETSSEEAIVIPQAQPVAGNVQAVTIPTKQATNSTPSTFSTNKPSTNAVKTPATNVETKPSTNTDKKPVTNVETKPSTEADKKPVANVETKPSTNTDKKPVTNVETKPSTVLSFIDLKGDKVEVIFNGTEEEFSGMFVFRDGAWVALNKADALKVNPFQSLNWTRNNLIKEAIQWERLGAPKELAWNKYYEFEAKREPGHYEVVNGYTRPNKTYLAQLVLSSLSAAKEAVAKGDTFTANEWLRNAQDHLNHYYVAPGKEVVINGLVNGRVPQLVNGQLTVAPNTGNHQHDFVGTPVTPAIDAVLPALPVTPEVEVDETPATDTEETVTPEVEVDETPATDTEETVTPEVEVDETPTTETEETVTPEVEVDETPATETEETVTPEVEVDETPATDTEV